MQCSYGHRGCPNNEVAKQVIQDVDKPGGQTHGGHKYNYSIDQLVATMIEEKTQRNQP